MNKKNFYTNNNLYICISVASYSLYLILGTLISSDYGISWDEPTSRMNGYVNLKYIFGFLSPSQNPTWLADIPDLATWFDRDYGVAFEAPLALLEVLLGYDKAQSYETYQFRHLITFLFCALGPLAIWLTLYVRWRSAGIALFGAFVFLASPRLFAESFYNSKDMVFLTSFAIALFTMTLFLTRPRTSSAMLHGFATAFAIDVRIAAVVICVMTLSVFALRLVKAEINPRQGVPTLLVYIMAVAGSTIALFPFLWADPLGHFALVFKNMAQFRWNSNVLFQGAQILASDLPWYYIPVWIGITLPLVTLAAFLTGTLVVVAQLANAGPRLWRDDGEMLDLVYLGSAVSPIAAVIMFDSIVYDGWRQLYFVYPGMILVAVRGVIALRSAAKDYPLYRHALSAIIATNLAWCLAWMVHAHPLQNVYFNAFAGADRKSQFEMDYWGLGNAEALRWIAEQEDGALITISALSATPVETSILALPELAGNRFSVIPAQLGTDGLLVPPLPAYLLNNFRGLPPDSSDHIPEGYSLVHERLVAGEPVYQVYRRD